MRAFVLLIGVLGTAVLAGLGVWQLQRLEWKESVLAEIEARRGAEPVALPVTATEAEDEYRPVFADGTFAGPELHVLVSQQRIGAGYRIVRAFETGERRIMVDLGFVRDDAKDAAREIEQARVTGVLHWPDEVDGFTPDPDRAANIWFAREVPVMSEALGTEPTLVVASALDPALPGVQPLPPTTAHIPNNHLGYAVQWFGLAA
ncbi:MAG: SURF1 family protein, partial [Shimia sp.]